MRLLFCKYLLCIHINIMSLSQTTENNSITVPHHNTLQHASMVSIKDDKPIMLDYYVGSKHNNVRLVKTQDKDTILFKTNDEYTSPLKKLFKIDQSKRNEQGRDCCDMIAISENSIYIIHSNILNN